ncbi:proprotein convertase subtilisin/kexin type 4-like [Acipenser oxyrinchus oxyrinchus]|uniref:Proprotein convertase subtilisin/kexin type 4-like n=1 Tax=Acipenser oxyrinchus oxyrinchus TaxID=40147 RepID=A0AAD8FV94_ACIOX|nr:proprotein convertase subtilisin/kexin type 4-like [Acipenser oxyrinchus oxyrinchus]
MIRLLFFVHVIKVCLAKEIYTNSWAALIVGSPEEADKIAQRHGFINLGKVFPDDNYYHLKHRAVAQMSLREHSSHSVRLKKHPRVRWFEQQTVKIRKRRYSMNLKTDPMFSQQWYLSKDFDLNVLSAWERGYSGRGVVVTVLDDGIEKNHPDLAANYDPDASYDIIDDDPDPQPRYTDNDENRHGTRCAGEVAAIANNGVCGVGVAFRAAIGGVRMLDGQVTDIVEARSLSLNPQHIHIYSASWGPEDNGKTVDGPGRLAREAFLRGITSGRGGLGSIFLWASGNGGFRSDNCNCDGYTNSMYTLSVGSATQRGTAPWYSEACSSILTTTYSSGSQHDRKIITTDIRQRCTDQHTGTSASAPLAAGIVALALEANPTLTWRDMQHLVIRASRPAELQASDWVRNGVGRSVSHHYGYGLLDAGKLVDLARKWEAVRPQRKCFIEVVRTPLTILGRLVISRNVSACAGTPDWIRSLEHTQARLSLTYSRRGDLSITLTSPRGTRSTLVAIRPFDTSTLGYSDWSFMTTHSWDEDPSGLWTLELLNKGDYRNTGILTRFLLELYGTDEDVAARPVESSVVHECKVWSLQGGCRECQHPLYVFNHLCLVSCPPHHYEWTQVLNSTPIRLCRACHPTCYTCRGSGAHNCTGCPPFSAFHPEKGGCLPPVYPKYLDMQEGVESRGGLQRLAAVAGIIVGIPLATFCLMWAASWLLARLPARSSALPVSEAGGGTEIVRLHVPSEDEAGGSESEALRPGDRRDM